MCPYCRSPNAVVIRKGFYPRAVGRAERVQRYGCKACRRRVSVECQALTSREKKPHLDQPLFRLLRTGISQRGCGRLLGIHPITLPKAVHETYSGRRGCVVGQSELKAGGRDPLFSLNHAAAMLRDRIKRLSRRTWCTTKRPDRLQLLVDLYARHHNETLQGAGRLVSV